MTEHEQEVRAIMNRCVHFNGIQHDTCAAGVNYQAIADRTQGGPILLPCWARDVFAGKNRTCTSVCERREFPSHTEAEREADEADAAIAMALADLQAGLCPTHKLPITKVQVGKCVYAKECGCRLYQGKVA